MVINQQDTPPFFIYSRTQLLIVTPTSPEPDRVGSLPGEPIVTNSMSNWLGPSKKVSAFETVRSASTNAIEARLVVIRIVTPIEMGSVGHADW